MYKNKPKMAKKWEKETPKSLVGCSVAPGFDFADFSFLKDDDTKLAARLTERDELSKFV